MKRLFVKKTAGFVALLMTLTMLVPIIAFAANSGFNGLSGQNGVVTGQVYVANDVYDSLGADPKVTVHVYFGDNTKDRYLTDGIYKSRSNDSVYYDVSVPSTVYPEYSTVTLKYYYQDQVIAESGSIARNFNNNNNGGGGFPGFFPPSNGVTVFANGKVDASSLIAAFQAAEGKATINTDIETIYIPAPALKDGKVLTIVHSDGVTYTLPVGALDLQKIADSLGVKLEDLVIRVDIKKLTGDAASKVTEAVNKIGAQVSAAVDFKVVAEGNGKEQNVDFGQYVSRTLPLTEVATETNQYTGVLFNAETNKLSFVPTTFATENDQTTATLKRNGNSIYTVAKVKEISFKDISATYWAKDYVNNLASKLVVEGTGENQFSPERTITRAEFAAMIVRALGIEANGTTSKFSDVASDKWFTGAVAAAAEAGIVKGNDKGQFNPNANVTRKEMATMVVRAMAYAGKEVTLTDAEVTAALAAYTDAGALGWAKSEVAVAIKEGIVKGQSATKVVGDANANRAEAATMVVRFLENVNFIN